MEVVYYILKMCLCFFVPLLVVAIGGLYAEKSGVLNIALEGIMVMGAFCGILFMHFMQVYIQGQLLLILAMIVSMIAGGLFTLLHALIQTYVLTMLTALFYGEVSEHHEKVKKKEK